MNNAATANPFEDTKPHISEYTAQEIATLQNRLNKRLGPEFISTRPGPGNQKVAYLSAEKAINLANEVFGFNGWSSSIQNIQIDFVDENPQTGKVTLGLSVVVRVTLKDGTYHEDIGYGGIENCKGKGLAFEKSKKEATTDALKRALRSFGNVLGNCMYDKDFITKVSKVKAGNGRFDINDLHRHPDFEPKTIADTKPVARSVATTSNTPSLEFEDSFDTSEFDDLDFNESDLAHPEEVVLPVDSASRRQQQGTKPTGPDINTPSKAPQTRPLGPQPVGLPRPPGQHPGNMNGPTTGLPGQPGVPTSRLPQAPRPDFQRQPDQNSSSPGMPSQHIAHQEQSTSGASMAPPGVFLSAKAAKNIDPNNPNSLSSSAIKFNPHAESPSIRKTAGVDHTKSVPVTRDMQKANSNPTPNIVDPRVDSNRRIGMPGQPASGPVVRPGMSTSAYRPPTRHGSPAVTGPATGVALPANAVDRVLTAAKRPPLGDVSNMQHSATVLTNDGADAKRQKVDTGGKMSAGIQNTVNPNLDGMTGA